MVHQAVTMLLFLTSLLTLVISAPNPQTLSTNWWKHASIYQIYPRSFKDSNNDGIGDLQGIIDKIDFFPASGIDAIWLSPVFTSPQADLGYDISNYTEVDPDYGSNQILENLVKEAHSRGVKILLDFVPNHTSNKHSWFVGSEDGDEEYRDYYVWAKSKVDGKRVPPNNWISNFSNSAWSWSDKRQEYYLHQFSEAQPDLNYRNPKVVAAMKNVLRFWLDLGVDGFRVDAVPFLVEDKDLRDEPVINSGLSSTDYNSLKHIYTFDQPETYNLIYDWRKFVDDYSSGTTVLMTEAYTSTKNTLLYYGTPDGSKLGAHIAFNFKLITDLDITSTAQDIVNTVNEWLQAIPDIYTSNWVLGNHDRPRVATRLGTGNIDGYNMLKSLLPGVAVTYNGEEIGQENGEVSYEEGQDPSARNRSTFNKVSRDFERTPYQWDDSVNAGFNSGAKPWLPVSEKYHQTNLKKEQEDGVSHYKVYQELAKLRKSLVSESVDIKAVGQNVVLLKRSGDSSVVLVFNTADEEAVVDVSDDVAEDNTIRIKDVNSQRELGARLETSELRLAPHEALIVTF